MRIRLGVSPDIDLDTMGEAIDAALEATTVSQVPLIESGKVPDIRKAIKAGKVKWKPEPPGDEHFDDAKTVLSRGWGDCDDLAPWLAASLRASGEDPDARAFVYQSGPKRWHAVVESGDGRVLDPSKWAGMGGKKKPITGIGAAAWAPMWPEQLGIAVHPYRGGFAGRVDLPDSDLPISWSAVSHGPTQARAAQLAGRAATRIADCVGAPYEEDWARLAGLDVLLSGNAADMNVVGSILGAAEEYLGPDGVEALIPAARALGVDVGSIFSKLGKIAKGGLKAVTKSPLVKAGLSFVPGGGAASAALDVANKVATAAKKGGGGSKPRPVPSAVTAPNAAALKKAVSQGGTTLSNSGGVVIVRF